MNCWVNRRGQGIALLNDDTRRLKYVFNIADVHKARYIGQDPDLWEMDEWYEDAEMKWLKSIYGSINENIPLTDSLVEIAEQIFIDFCRNKERITFTDYVFH